MNFSFLQSFLSVARKGSFTAAASELFITQPAISQHIQALEEQLGVLLFVRQGKGVLLTSEGRELQKHVEEMFTLMENAQTAIQERSSLKRGSLKIAITEVISYLIPQVLIDFKNAYPGLNVNIFTHRGATVLKLVAEGKVACGIAHKPALPPSTLSSRHVHNEALVLAAPAGHHLEHQQAVRPKDLKNEIVVLRESGTLNRALAVHWFGRGNLPNHFIEANSMSSMRSLVLAGAVAFIPKCVVKRDLEQGRIIALNKEEPYADMAYQ